MSTPMDKATFLEILRDIVEGFEDADFRTQMAEAQSNGNVAAMMALPMGVQERAFRRHGLDASQGTVAFKEAGRSYGLDPEAAPLLQRMKAALK